MRESTERVFYGSWYRIVKSVIILVPSRVFMFFADSRPGSRFACFVYIVYCTAQTRRTCHISKNIKKKESSWNGEKGKLLYGECFGLRSTHSFFLVRPRDDHPWNCDGPLWHETCRGSSMLPFIGWQCDRNNTRLNTVQNREFFWRLKTRGLFLLKVLLLKWINGVCRFVGFSWKLARLFFRY